MIQEAKEALNVSCPRELAAQMPLATWEKLIVALENNPEQPQLGNSLWGVNPLTEGFA